MNNRVALPPGALRQDDMETASQADFSQFGFAPVACNRACHFVISSATNLSVESGVEFCETTMPSSKSRVANPGSASAALIDEFMTARLVDGAPAGARIAFQV